MALHRRGHRLHRAMGHPPSAPGRSEKCSTAPADCKASRRRTHKFFTTYGKMLVFPKTLWYTAYCLLLQAVSGNVSTQKKEGFFVKSGYRFPLLIMRRVPEGRGGAGGRIPSGHALRLAKRHGGKGMGDSIPLFLIAFLQRAFQHETDGVGRYGEKQGSARRGPVCRGRSGAARTRCS